MIFAMIFLIVAFAGLAISQYYLLIAVENHNKAIKNILDFNDLQLERQRLEREYKNVS